MSFCKCKFRIYIPFQKIRGTIDADSNDLSMKNLAIEASHEVSTEERIHAELNEKFNILVVINRISLYMVKI